MNECYSADHLSNLSHLGNAFRKGALHWFKLIPSCIVPSYQRLSLAAFPF